MEDAEFRNHAEKVIDKIVGGDFGLIDIHLKSVKTG